MSCPNLESLGHYALDSNIVFDQPYHRDWPVVEKIERIRVQIRKKFPEGFSKFLKTVKIDVKKTVR